jgi:ribosomal protein L37AE/L43A
MAQQETMSLLEFMERFGTAESCRDYLYQIRWSKGFVCPKCATKDEPFNIKARNVYQCRHCTHQASVTAGTIMDKTRTPLTKWFMAIYLMGQDKRGCSALKLKRELKIAYDTAWTMSHKIRKAMGDRDSLYLLSGIVEIDDSFFGAAHEGSKRGRGTDKTPVAFALSLNEKGRPGYLRAKVCSAVDGDNLVEFAKDCIAPGSVLRSDGLPAYGKLSKEGFRLESEAFDPKENPEHLKWIHVVVSNVKAFIAGTYHGLDDIHLQAFLDEFCYRFNRRRWLDQLFARTLNACVFAKPFTRYELIG